MLNPLLEQIIANEMEKRLNRKPTNIESKSAYIEVLGNYNHTDCLDDIAKILSNYITNNYTKCEQCGEYHMEPEMQTIQGPDGEQKVCSNKDCELCAYNDVHFGARRDLATY